MRVLAIIATILGLFISSGANAGENSRAELERAIANLTTRNGPPAAYTDNRSVLLPAGLLQHNLWQRLRTRFELTGFDHPDIDAQVDYFRSGRFSLQRNLANAEPFLYHVVDQIDRAGLPLDLAMLPLVESAYNPHARSQQQAVGIWQFIPSTAEIFGLTVNDDYDGRKDVIASTQAAIEYLRKLHTSFDGDWLLALAAYNTGPSNVRSAITRAKKAGVEPTFWNLKLPRETRNYVPRILAAVRVISSPATIDLTLPDIANRKAVDTVAVGRPLEFSRVVSATEVPMDQLVALNPGHQNRQIPHGGPYHLVLPAATSTRLIAELRQDKLGPLRPATVSGLHSTLLSSPNLRYRVVPDAYLPNASLPPPFKPYKKYVYQSHEVKPGDSLWGISRAMDTDIDTLLDWNGRSEKPLQPGDQLIAAYVGEEQPEDLQQEMMHYRVHADDTLTSISDKFNLSISDLKKWNPSLWDKNFLQAGQSINIPVSPAKDL
ncbi:MAG: transglycosylase SLT domain-containing protein [Pseudomonadota bacterium]